MTEFVYRKTIDGKATLLPHLKTTVESRLPKHNKIIHDILTSEHMPDWKIVFSPDDKRIEQGRGYILRPLKTIIILLHTGKEMMVTLLHEILHHKYPNLDELATEKLGYKDYKERYGAELVDKEPIEGGG